MPVVSFRSQHIACGAMWRKPSSQVHAGARPCCVNAGDSWPDPAVSMQGTSQTLLCQCRGQLARPCCVNAGNSQTLLCQSLTADTEH
jgi:hypothetical protein